MGKWYIVTAKNIEHGTVNVPQKYGSLLHPLALGGVRSHYWDKPLSHNARASNVYIAGNRSGGEGVVGWGGWDLCVPTFARMKWVGHQSTLSPTDVIFPGKLLPNYVSPPPRPKTWRQSKRFATNVIQVSARNSRILTWICLPTIWCISSQFTCKINLLTHNVHNNSQRDEVWADVNTDLSGDN